MKKRYLFGVICIAALLSACGEESISNEVETPSVIETEAESQEYNKAETFEKREDIIKEDIDYRKMYANEESIDAAQKIILEIAGQLSKEDIEGGDYIYISFWSKAIRVELCDNQDDSLRYWYYDPNTHSLGSAYNYPVDSYEKYDEYDRLYMRCRGFDCTIYKYDDQGRVIEDENIYNYFYPDYLADNIMEDIETDENDYAYIDNVSDAIYSIDEKIYKYLEYDYVRNRYEYSDDGKCVRQFLYDGAEDDTLFDEIKFIYDGEKLIRELHVYGGEQIDYEYDGDVVIAAKRYVEETLSSTTKYYYDADMKTKLALEEFTDSSLNSELNGFVYFNK